MNIQELIQELEKLNNQEREVYIFFEDDIYPINMIDDSIDDRLDINI
jgi:uncharacterized protein YerC